LPRFRACRADRWKSVRALVRAAGRTFDQLAYGFQPYERLPSVVHGTDELAPTNLNLARQ
jgi:hypothetical protein